MHVVKHRVPAFLPVLFKTEIDIYFSNFYYIVATFTFEIAVEIAEHSIINSNLNLKLTLLILGTLMNVILDMQIIASFLLCILQYFIFGVGSLI